jgi:hypothetical protein
MSGETLRDAPARAIRFRGIDFGGDAAVFISALKEANVAHFKPHNRVHNDSSEAQLQSKVPVGRHTPEPLKKLGRLHFTRGDLEYK